MRCAEAKDILDLLVAGDLPEEETLAYREHIESCPACRQEFARITNATAAIRETLTEAVLPDDEAIDVWPRVQAELDRRTHRRFGFRWPALEPVRILAAAGALTVGLFLITNIQYRSELNGGETPPVYESNSVIVSTAKVGERPARVSGIESGDGQTVFLWLE